MLSCNRLFGLVEIKKSYVVSSVDKPIRNGENIQRMLIGPDHYQAIRSGLIKETSTVILQIFGLISKFYTGPNWAVDSTLDFRSLTVLAKINGMAGSWIPHLPIICLDMPELPSPPEINIFFGCIYFDYSVEKLLLLFLMYQ